MDRPHGSWDINGTRAEEIRVSIVGRITESASLA